MEAKAATPINGNPRRIAVVTGANKGIGLETAKQLAAKGITVVLTARNEKRGSEARDSLHEKGLKNVMFHELDVLDPLSVQSLASFLTNNFGKLDILVNNAASTGTMADEERLKALNIDPETWYSEGKASDKVKEVMISNYSTAELCLNTNFYGVKRVTQALLPLLELSSGARIVNMSSVRGKLRRIGSDEIRNELKDIETLTEEKLDRIVERFMQDLKDNRIEEGGWSKMFPAYGISKAILNAYTRILAKKHPEMVINCVHPGYVNTDMNWHTGPLPVEEGAKGPVKCALLPNEGPTGCFFYQTQVEPF